MTKTIVSPPNPVLSTMPIVEARSTGARYLFLQGPIGPFFGELAARLSPSGAGIHRILLSGGDSIYWRVPGSRTVDWRHGIAQWPDFIRDRLADWTITDLVLFGDCRPLHRIAIRIAQLRGIRVHVFEEGYLRPHWITLEEGGVNRHSSLPRDPEWYLSTARPLRDLAEAWPVPVSFPRRAAEDVLYTLSMTAQRWRFPGYRTHKPWHPLLEYAAGARRFPFKAAVQRRAAEVRAQLIAREQPYFLFPLQLHADAQIRFHSPFGDMATAIGAVVDSFARAAPRGARLVVTEHPLDNGVIDLEAVTHAAATAAGIAHRVVFIAGGSPEDLMRASRGLVTINSTIGIVALGLGLPVAALGDAIYGLPGLVFQGRLDEFWDRGVPADPVLYDAFRRVVLTRTQVNGGFYSVAGRRMAVEGSARRLAMSPGTAVVAGSATRTAPAHTTVDASEARRSEFGA